MLECKELIFLVFWVSNDYKISILLRILTKQFFIASSLLVKNCSDPLQPDNIFLYIYFRSRISLMWHRFWTHIIVYASWSRLFTRWIQFLLMVTDIMFFTGINNHLYPRHLQRIHSQYVATLKKLIVDVFILHAEIKMILTKTLQRSKNQLAYPLQKSFFCFFSRFSLQSLILDHKEDGA